MTRWKIRVGMTAVVVCAGLQMGCSTGWGTDYTESKTVVTTTQTGQAGLVFPRGEGWTEAGVQYVSDVTRKQVFTFDFNRKDVCAVRLEAAGKLVGGKAMLKMSEKCPRSAAPEEVELFGDFTSNLMQHHKHHKVGVVSLEYVPEGVTSGNLKINVWHRAD